MASVTVRYFAAARAASGCDEDVVEVPVGGTVHHALDAVRVRHGNRMAKVLLRCSFLLDEVAVRSQARALGDGATLDVLPPFAGG